MKKLLTIVGIVLLTGIAVRADVIAIPPRTLTLTGTLGWSAEKRADGREVRDRLTLTTTAGKVITLLRSSQVENPGQYDPLLGKKVVVKVLGYETRSRRGEPEVVVESVTSIEAAPAAKR
jgi:hypothetical protein